MNVTDGLAHLKEAFVLIDSSFVFAQVVIEHTCRVICAAFISGFTSTLASESKNVVVLETFLGGDAVIGVSVCHVEAAVRLEH